jgi:two-component system sensor histidine kinase and response regulator WspE
VSDPEKSDIQDLSMLDLFRSEVDIYAAILNDGLLALENNPEATDRIKDLMGAAHSLKGGARIVKLDGAVQLLHTMEDCFTAVRDRQYTLTSEHIDILLQAVDVLNRIAENPTDKDREAGDVERLIARIAEIPKYSDAESSPSGADASLPPSALPSARETPAVDDKKDRGTPPAPLSHRPVEREYPPVSAPSVPAPDALTCLRLRSGIPSEARPPEGGGVTEEGEKERTVRVTAWKIERLMGLAGEVVVGAKWFPSFFEELLKLKRAHAELSGILEEIQQSFERKNDARRGRLLAIKAREKAQICGRQLGDRLNHFDKFTRASVTLADRLYHEVIGVRMCPFSQGLRGYPRMVRDLARELGKKVRFHVAGESTEVDRDILERLDAPLNHLLRNAVDHGIELPENRLAAGKPEIGNIHLEAAHRAGMLMITVSDDGRGVHPEDIRAQVLSKGLATPDIAERLTEPELMEFLFLQGFSTTQRITEISGRGVGLDVVHTIVHEVGGVIRAASTPGQGTSFQLELPLTLSVIRTFLVEIAGEPYAFPLARIDRCLRLDPGDVLIVEDRQYFRLGDENIALINIHDVLEIDAPPRKNKTINAVIVNDRTHSYALAVDDFLGESDLVVQPLGNRMGKIPDISAAAVMEEGSPVLIFDVEDLVHSIGSLLNRRLRLKKIEGDAVEKAQQVPKRILVVDDSFIVREKERKLLENKGYEVEVAVDGMDGWNLLRISDFDMVVTDIDMPRMNGFELIQHIKTHDTLKSLPVIIVSYKMSEEDRLQGFEAGADYYLHKTDFDDNSLINAVVDLIGES